MEKHAKLHKAEFGWDRLPEGEILFSYPVQEETRRIIADIFRSKDIIVKKISSLRNFNTISGGYVVEAVGQSLFVRISSRLGDPALESAILKHLESRGVRVNPILFSHLVRDGTKRVFRMDIRPLLLGTHFNGGSSQLADLAEELAQLHNTLSMFPLAKVVKNNAAARYKGFAARVSQLEKALMASNWGFFRERAGWARKNKNWLGKMVEGFSPFFHRLDRSQPVHGEVHPGNVVYTVEGPVFIDFEESIHMYVPPDWDTAYLIQRFCMADEPQGADLRKRLRVIETHLPVTLREAAGMIRQASFMSMAVLLDLRLTQQVVSPEAEFNKFVRLEAQATKLERL